jgi:uncharacterized membrane protein
MFQNQTRFTFSQFDIEMMPSGRRGVYVIYAGSTCLYVGASGVSMQDRMRAHLNGDIPGLLAWSPTHFTIEETWNPWEREVALTLALRPLLNRKVG